MTPDDRPTRALGVEATYVRKSFLLVKDGNVYKLNEVEQLIWKNCTGENSLARIAAGISESFDVTAETALADLTEFIGQLSAAGLVTA